MASVVTTKMEIGEVQTYTAHLHLLTWEAHNQEEQEICILNRIEGVEIIITTLDEMLIMTTGSLIIVMAPFLITQWPVIIPTEDLLEVEVAVA